MLLNAHFLYINKTVEDFLQVKHLKSDVTHIVINQQNIFRIGESLYINFMYDKKNYLILSC
jgi:hypothetical protein